MVDHLFDAVGHVQRRRILISLLEHNPQQLAGLSVRSSTHDVTADQLLQYQHVHLPKLVDAGFIEWNRDAQTIAKGSNFDEIRSLLELLHEHREELPAGWL